MSIFKCRFHGKIFKWIECMAECSRYNNTYSRIHIHTQYSKYVVLVVLQNDASNGNAVRKTNRRIDVQSVWFTFNLWSKDQLAFGATECERPSVQKALQQLCPFFHRLLHIKRPMKLDRFIDRSNNRSIRSINRSINRCFRWKAIFMASPQIIRTSTASARWKTIWKPKMDANRSTDISVESIVRAINITLQWVQCLSHPACEYLWIIHCLLNFCPHTCKNAHTHVHRTYPKQ